MHCYSNFASYLCTATILMLSDKDYKKIVHPRLKWISSQMIFWPYCKTRKCSGDKFSLISPSKCFRSFHFRYSMAILFYIITKITNLEAFYVYGFASSAKINCMWNFLVLQYPIGTCNWVMDLLLKESQNIYFFF